MVVEVHRFGKSVASCRSESMGIKETPEDNDQTPAMGRTERKKVMGQLHISLDPARVGPDATSLQRARRAMIIGQDEAVNHIVDVYPMYVTGVTAMAQMAQAGVGPSSMFLQATA